MAYTSSVPTRVAGIACHGTEPTALISPSGMSAYSDSTLSYAVGVRIASSQQVQEGCLVPQLLLKFTNSLLRRPGDHIGNLPKIGRIGDKKIDKWRLLFDCRHRSLQGLFRAHIACDRNERTIFLKSNQLKKGDRKSLHTAFDATSLSLASRRPRMKTLAAPLTSRA